MPYIENHPIVSGSPVVYHGERDPQEVLCTVEWTLADLLDAMNLHGIDLTDENIETVLSNRFSRTLQDRSIEEGWQIISDLVAFSF